jgi:hypothetical protein
MCETLAIRTTTTTMTKVWKMSKAPVGRTLIVDVEVAELALMPLVETSEKKAKSLGREVLMVPERR